MNRKRHQPNLDVEPDVVVIDEMAIEIYEPETAGPTPPPARPGHRARLTASIPGAVAGVFLVCALAFGANWQGDSTTSDRSSTGGPATGTEGTALGDRVAGTADGPTGVDSGDDAGTEP